MKRILAFSGNLVLKKTSHLCHRSTVRVPPVSWIPRTLHQSASFFPGFLRSVVVFPCTKYQYFSMVTLFSPVLCLRYIFPHFPSPPLRNSSKLKLAGFSQWPSLFPPVSSERCLRCTRHVCQVIKGEVNCVWIQIHFFPESIFFLRWLDYWGCFQWALLLKLMYFYLMRLNFTSLINFGLF